MSNHVSGFQRALSSKSTHGSAINPMRISRLRNLPPAILYTVIPEI